MTSANYIRNIAIVGASGNSGRGITAALLQTGHFTLTALTRSDSPSTFAAPVHVAYIDYSDPQTLESALHGQDALIITLPTGPLSSLQTHLIQAAARAGVPWILPNEWAQDSEHAGLVADMGMEGKRAARREIAEAGVAGFVGIVTGPWFEMGLREPAGFGFDVRGRKVTMYDRGTTPVCASTYAMVGRAVAGILSLPVRGEGTGLCLENFRNRLVYLSSFTVTQEEVFASILRVTGQRREDWEVGYEGIRERYERARRGEGLDPGEARRMRLYARIFFPDDCANFEKTKGTINRSLGLPVEDLDQVTRETIDLINRESEQ